MSHITEVKTEFTSLDAIEAACRALEIETERNALVRGYKGATETCELVAKLDQYDVGFVATQDGKITILSDQWGVNGFEERKLAGLRNPKKSLHQSMIERLTQQCAVATIKAKMKNKGALVRSAAEGGSLLLKYTV